ncbi:hypothetical protein OH76DRAFT_838691 [Lentinus brumalis]|uniref:Uncharacterized protein n=1 Tax=Lentinus brumalis TaxID=2498619 RepID=A0A371D1M6_9APHY|nr:hypothetical protein OH76DRAFT_838691 [Polyporus brumalis]
MRVGDVRPVPVTSAPQDPANLNDGRTFAYTRSEAYVAISPNADFVPEPPVGLVQVYLCEDFRYGIYDPIQWPQVFSDDFEYVCAIRRRNPVVERLYPRIWDTPVATTRTVKAIDGTSTGRCCNSTPTGKCEPRSTNRPDDSMPRLKQPVRRRTSTAPRPVGPTRCPTGR